MGFFRQTAILATTTAALSAGAWLPTTSSAAVFSAARWVVPLLCAVLLLVAIRFHESRTALASSALLAVTGAVGILAPGIEATRWFAALVAVELAFTVTVREPNIDWEVFGYWWGWLLASVAVLFALDRYAPLPIAAAKLAGAADIRIVAIACAFIFILAFALIKRDPVTNGLGWAVLPMTLAVLDPHKLGLASGISAIVLTIALIERSYWIAYFDELTGLKGRRAFSEVFATLRSNYSLAVVDIDHFKSFNDTYGHDVGDQVLRKVAAHLARVTGGGQPYRCGGEEFVLIFKGRTATDAMKHVERLRRSIEDDVFHVRGPERSRRERDERRRFHKKDKHSRHESVRVTVSIGLAEAPEGCAPQQVYKAADKALYRAKNAGRNRIELARRGSSQATGMIPEQVR